MKTLSGCANSLCDREVLPAKPGSSGESHYDISKRRLSTVWQILKFLRE
ncbi:hypothetical protein P0195_23180 [Escherichia coli]|nr:hypothetical protein [Escherichia coli]